MWTSGGEESEEQEIRGEQGGVGERRKPREARGEKETEEMRKCGESEESLKREREERDEQRGELREGERRIYETPPGLEDEERAHEAHEELRRAQEGARGRGEEIAGGA